MCLQSFIFWEIDVILNGGVTFVLEAITNEDLAYEKGVPLDRYVAFSY